MSTFSFLFKTSLLITIYQYILTSAIDNIKEIDLQYRNGFLFMQLEIGTPPQWFNVIYDTTSFHLCLPNITLRSTFPKTYNPRFSRSYEESDSTVYQVVGQRGTNVQDFLGFFRQGPLSQNKKFNFMLLNTAPQASTVKYIYDGLFGFGKKYPGKILEFRSYRNIEAHPRFSLVNYLYVNNMINTKKVGFKFLSRNHARLTFGYDEVALNGDNNNAMNNIMYCDDSDIPTHLDPYWICKSRNIILENNNTIIYENMSYLIIDSTYDGLKLPQAVGSAILRAIEAAFQGLGNYKFGVGQLGTQVFYPSGKGFNLLQVPNFQFTINDRFSLKLTGKDLFTETAMEINGKQTHGYRSVFVFGTSTKDVYLGIPFMKRYHIVFDNENSKIGFGEYVGDNVLNSFSRGFWPRRDRWEWTHVVIVILSLIIIVGVVYQYRKKQLKKKYKKGLINKGIEKRKNQEELIEPIGKPMISVEK